MYILKSINYIIFLYTPRYKNFVKKTMLVDYIIDYVQLYFHFFWNLI
jgi:hypothetical protein